MSKTNWQDPQSGEMRSTHISGLMEAVGKLEDTIGMPTTTEAGITLSEVFISSNDRYRIFQVPANKRNWLFSPAPVIRKNGTVITSGFTIDYGGGAIILNANDTVLNTYTADVTYITASNAEILKQVTNPSYLAPETFYGAGSINSLAIQSPMAACVASGQVEMNLVSNGNFANGTTGWIPSNATQSVTNNVNTVTGNGTSGAFWTAQVLNAKTNQKLFIRAMVRVTDSACSKIILQFYDGSTSIEAKRQTTPVANQWYQLYGVLSASANAVANGNISVMAFYADGTTANGKQMQIDGNNGNGVTVIDMGTDSSNPLYNLTADQMNQRYPNYIPNTLTNTAPQELVIVNSNNICPPIGNKISFVAGVAANSAKIPMRLQSPVFSFAAFNNGVLINPSSNISLQFFDANKNLLDYWAFSSNPRVVNASQPLAYWDKIRYFNIGCNTGVTATDITNIMIVNGSNTITSYEPYSDTVIQIPSLNAVSDTVGMKDTFDAIQLKKTQNVKNYTLISTDIEGLDTSGINTDRVQLKTFSDMIPSTNSNIIQGKTLVKGYPEKGYLDDASNFNTHYYSSGSQKITICIPKGTYTNLAAAQTALSGTVIQYQLAKPIETLYLQPTVINAVPNGLVYTNPALTFADGYSTKMSVPSMYSGYPIKNLKYVNKISPATGTLTPIDLSTCTVAGDGLSFTITGAVAGECYDFGWYPAVDSTIPVITTTCSSDLKAAVNELVNALSRASNLIDRLQDEITVLNRQIIKTYATKADCTDKIAGQTTIKAIDLNYKILTWDGSAWRDAMGVIVS